ncbi:Chaperone protein DnaJ [uncultured Desulfobacterium sp.]|uniref:Chaperone protein DnaJ n=1 Tax=uncultured Desulfobacterium sp. TaxID=201089 RepID=A0A445N2P0_9BACT|nr:Chaperone protein DnaJ [uncultured Desulfobacterium sp.]
MSEDFYKILGVSKDAEQDVIKKAYRKLARKWHPDVNPGNKEAEQKFKEISRAYDCLGNKEKRKLYDEFGEAGLQSGFDAEKARQYSQWGAYQQEGRGEARQDFGKYASYEDVFGDLFGKGGFRQSAGGFGTSYSSKGADLQHDMEIDLISALKGFETELSMQKARPCTVCNGSGSDPKAKITTCSKCGGSGRINVSKGPMQFTRTCPQCGGHGQVGKPCAQCGGSGQVVGMETIKVTIPQGVKEGSKVRVAGKGEPGMGGAEAGDLYLIIHVKPHPILRREEDNLYIEIPVTVAEAMKGGSITIPTIEGMIQVKVPPKSQSGQTLRLKGKGAVNLKTKKRGDLMVKLIIKVPQTDDKEILEAAEKMERFYAGDLRQAIRL